MCFGVGGFKSSVRHWATESVGLKECQSLPLPIAFNLFTLSRGFGLCRFAHALDRRIRSLFVALHIPNEQQQQRPFQTGF